MWYDRILELFRDGQRGVSGKPGFWHARCPCPAHRNGDRNPSLSIWLGHTGCILIRCWRGCPLPEILSCVGLKMAEMFPPDKIRYDGPYERESVRYKESPRREIEETFDYTDEDGKLLYQNVRWKPKAFSMRRPGPGRDGWSWSVPQEVRRVLFHLPLLIEASPLLPVLVCEGERKVYAAERLGFVATCNAGGGNHWQENGWRDEYSRCLVGRRVVILPDNDDVGRRHAIYIAGSLLVYGAASIRVVQLPGLAEHGDLVDWVAQGGTREELIALVRATPQWRADGATGLAAGATAAIH